MSMKKRDGGELGRRRWVDGPPPPAWGGGLAVGQWQSGEQWRSSTQCERSVMRGRAWGGWHLQDRVPGASAYSLFLTPLQLKTKGVLLNIRANYTTFLHLGKINKVDKTKKTLKLFHSPWGEAGMPWVSLRGNTICGLWAAVALSPVILLKLQPYSTPLVS